MERTAFELLKDMESSWWYRGRSFAIQSALAHAGIRTIDTALDYGAGFGGAHSLFASIAKQTDAYEPDEIAARSVLTRGYARVITDKKEALSGAYDLIGLFDVLEHIEHDADFLMEAHQALTPKGRLIVTVPAFQALWSAHDEEHHHFRRYSRSEIKNLFRKAGYEIDYVSYWNASLLPVAATLRLWGGSGEGGLSPHPFINSVLSCWLRMEAAIIGLAPLPFGLSLVVVARKKSAPAQESFLKKMQFLARYALSGVTGGLIQLATLYVWVDIGKLEEWYLGGVITGFVLALAATFILQKFWTFRDRNSTRAPMQFLFYASVALSGLALNALILSTARHVFESFSMDFFNGWYL